MVMIAIRRIRKSTGFCGLIDIEWWKMSMFVQCVVLLVSSFYLKGLLGLFILY